MTKPIHTLLLVFGLLIVFSIVNVYLINDSRVSFRKETEKLSNLLHVNFLLNFKKQGSSSGSKRIKKYRN
jgi:hypothetical protein